MEAVAAAAQTSKPVLYRRWPDRRALLRDTLLGTATSAIPSPDTGSFRDDMLAVLRGWVRLFTGENATLMQSVIVAVTTDPELATTFRTEVLGLRKREMNAILARGVRRGEVRPDVPVELVRELGPSVLWHRLLVSGDAITDELVIQLVDEVITPVTRPYYET